MGTWHCCRCRRAPQQLQHQQPQQEEGSWVRSCAPPSALAQHAHSLCACGAERAICAHGHVMHTLSPAQPLARQATLQSSHAPAQPSMSCGVSGMWSSQVEIYGLLRSCAGKEDGWRQCAGESACQSVSQPNRRTAL